MPHQVRTIVATPSVADACAAARRDFADYFGCSSAKVRIVSAIAVAAAGDAHDEAARWHVEVLAELADAEDEPAEEAGGPLAA